MPVAKDKALKAIKQFSRYAHQYNSYNIIQEEVAKHLVDMLDAAYYPTIIDIGCGSGAVYKYLQERDISCDEFYALDSSLEMLGLHPQQKEVLLQHADFNIEESYTKIPTVKNGLIVSSSALQWSEDLDLTLGFLSQKTKRAYFAIFTANTFSTLHQKAGIESPIYTCDIVQSSIEKYYDATFTVNEYKLIFDSVSDMFHYIKKSGVSGGVKRLSYVETKKLMKEYPLAYLEFEVLFVEATSLT